MKLKQLAFFFIATASLCACKKDQYMAKSQKEQEIKIFNPSINRTSSTPTDTTGISIGGEDKPKPTHP